MSLSSINLDAFYTVAQCGNFTTAAKKLFVTQSALSQRIAKLEDELETSLLIRDPQKLKLTAAGECLLRYCQTKNALETEALNQIKSEGDQLSGTIRIGGFSSVMRSVVLPALSPTLRNNPDLNLVFINGELSELPHLLRSSAIDYMILYDDMDLPNVEKVHLGDEKNVLAHPSAYKAINVFLDHDENDRTTERYLKKYAKTHVVQRRYLDDVYGLIDGVKNGLGKAIIPVHLIHDHKSIRIINPKNHILFPVNLYFYKKPYYSKVHHEIITTLTDATPKLLAPKR